MSFKSLPLLPLALLAAHCTPVAKIRSPEDAAQDLQRADSIVFAYDLAKTCNLQQYGGELLPKDRSEWASLSSTEVVNHTYRVLESRSLVEREGDHEVVSMALHLASRDGAKTWIRNAPQSTVESATDAWSCAVDQKRLASLMPALKAQVVQLAPSSAKCSEIVPIFGDVSSVTFAPYTVTGRTLFKSANKTTIGVRLEADGGEKALTVPGTTLDQCFAAADQIPPPPREARELTTWLQDPTKDAPPNVSSDTFYAITGLTPDRCMREGTGLTTHYECRTPILQITASKTVGPYGPPVIRIQRERVVESMHVYAKRLISPTDVIDVTAAVRLRGGSASVTKAFNAELEKSLVDDTAAEKRASNGFRLLRSGDGGAAATHVVSIELNFETGAPTSRAETRTHRYSAGQKTIDNPRFGELTTAVETKRKELGSAQQALESAKQLAESAAKVAGDLCKKGASQASGNLPFGLGAVANVAAEQGCAAGAKTIVTTAEASAVERITKELQAAQSELAKTSKTTSMADEREVSYEAKVLTRSGDATAKVSIGAGSAPATFSTTIGIHFEATDVEFAGNPEVQLPAKVAKMPTDDDVEHQLAAALVPRIDESVIKWAAQRQIGGDIGDLKPGTRSWMVAVARNAASDRPVKLLSDLLENRPDELSQKYLEFPVVLPKAISGRCFTFAAIPQNPMADANMMLGRIGEGDKFVAVARDSRAVSDSAFEVCDLAPGTYSVRVSFSNAKDNKLGVLVSMFDSTPGAATNRDTMEASKGLPTLPRKGEELTLNGEGVVRFRGTNNAVVTGKPGDRDGDGVPDDDDRCPYDPESKNDYLDDDGCPDVAPAKGSK